jgi:hypothetical protein
MGARQRHPCGRYPVKIPHLALLYRLDVCKAPSRCERCGWTTSFPCIASWVKDCWQPAIMAAPARFYRGNLPD